MKKLLIITGILLLGFNILAFADDTTKPGNPNAHPCKNIIKACKSAGFTRKDKSLFQNCLQPILQGQTVNGVNVDPADVQGCQAKRSQIQNKLNTDVQD